MGLLDVCYFPFGSEHLSRQIATELILTVHEGQNASRERERKNSLSLYLIYFPSLRRRGLFTGALRNPRGLFPHNPRAAYRWADHGGSQQALQASNEGSHLRGRRVPPSLPKCPRLATLAIDSSTVKGNPETSESVQILRFRPITHLIGHRA